MPVIELQLKIAAPIERLFDLSRSVDLHMLAAENSKERVIGGVTSGLMELGDEVVWSARHFGIRQALRSRITEFSRPTHFRDAMVSGAFKRFDHDHHFSEANGICLLRDRFDFDAPLGVLGVLANQLFLKRYMTRFLCARNDCLRRIAESDKWMDLLPSAAKRG